MAGKIFISCGQATEEERNIASSIKDELTTLNFKPYIAIETQSIQDVNAEIIKNLKSADYYIFIDFARDQILASNNVSKYRGSLFTNQELAIAYILKFEHVLFLQQEGVELEGIGKYLLSNARQFSSKSEVIGILKNEIITRKWHPTYSRHLIVNELCNAGIWNYGDHAHYSKQQIWHITIKNLRHDIAAFDTVARLNKIILDNDLKIDCHDRSFLKWAGKRRAYLETILPKDIAKFDALAIDTRNPLHVFLHSEEDKPPRQPIVNQLGKYRFQYQVFSKDFPMIDFEINLELTGNIETTKVSLKNIDKN